MSAQIKLIAGICLIVYAFSADVGPTVTLSHGGKLQGVTSSFMDTTVDVFVGVRYAQPPVGNLRFKKPAEVPAWEGTVDAKTVGNICPQLRMGMTDSVMKYLGDEDCLTLDITVPGRLKPGAKKPVMVWIHGGGYMGGTGIVYLGGSLAVTGDIIVVTVNYRLGYLGFLSKGKGTGNYGLWDQRAALVWVQQNIAQFGGDPDLVTIFGESAGGGSVSSQTIGQHNDGLFKRAITQSGSAFMMGGMSENVLHKLAATIRQQAKCNADADVYECLSDKTPEEIVRIVPTSFLMPYQDGDFFSEETSKLDSYELSKRFDYMGGINGQEGGLVFAFEMAAVAKSLNKSDIYEAGIDTETAQAYLNFKCSSQITPFSASLCADFLMKEYKIAEAANDKERAARLVQFGGEFWFNIDTTNQLEQHSSGDKSTYGYYFTELYKPSPPNPLWALPNWLKTSADHADEIPFVFGVPYLKPELQKNDLWKEMVRVDEMSEDFLIGTHEGDTKLSKQIMTMWTNFAKSGNPNEPIPLAAGTAVWPQFDTESNHFLELNSKLIKVVTTPNKERLDRVRSHLFTARQQQVNADQPPRAADKPKEESSSKREEL